MEAFNIEFRDKELIINMDTTGIPQDKLLKMIQRIRVEFLAQKAAIEDNVIFLAEEANEKWRGQNKDEFLKNVKK